MRLVFPLVGGYPGYGSKKQFPIYTRDSAAIDRQDVAADAGVPRRKTERTPGLNLARPSDTAVTEG